METTRLSTKGQIVLPRRIREARSWRPGMEFAVEETTDGVLLRPEARFPATNLDQVAGCLGYRGKAKPIEEMNAAIGAEVERRHGRGRY